MSEDSQGGLVVKNLPAKQEMWIQSLSWEDVLEKEMATHSRILAWEISWTEEPGGLQSMGLQNIRHELATKKKKKRQKSKYTITRGECNHAVSIITFQSNKIIFLAISPAISPIAASPGWCWEDKFLHRSILLKKEKISWKPLNTISNSWCHK